MTTGTHAILIYLDGVEYGFEYDSEEKYDSAKAFLDARLQPSSVFANDMPVPRTTYYYVESHQRATLEAFARWSEQGEG
jgi:hypothetical protein